MANFLKALTESRKIIVSLIWLAVAFIVLASVGGYLYRRYSRAPQPRPTTAQIPAPAVDWSAVDASIVDAAKAAHATAEAQANAKLDAWIASLMKRVDGDFLDWYFSYWTQQVIGLKSVWYWSVNQVISGQPTMAEKITEDIQEEFAKRVLRPQVSQLEIERITREVLEVYVTELSNSLKSIPGRYKIPQPAWERHLEDIAVLTANTEGNREVPLTMKSVAVSSAVAGSIAVKSLAPAIGNAAGKISPRLAGKATARIAAKTGTKVAARGGGKFAGPIIAIGVIIWDVWDHHQTKNVERPILRQTLVDYFAEMKQSFLHEPESGILAIIGSIEADIVKQLRK